MKQFLAIFMGSANGETAKRWNALDEREKKERGQAGMTAWTNWGIEHQQAIITSGPPLGKTKLVNAQGISDIRNNMTAYAVVQAENHEAAAKMFLNHPHFTIFPGDSVEIMECLPMPSM